MHATLCTLFEGNYHFGVAALSNSLVAAGYSGELCVGYRGALPPWVLDSPSFDSAHGVYQVNQGFRLKFILLETELHFTYYKPVFIRDIFKKYAPDSDIVAYIDPDIVTKCDWVSLQGWFAGGIALVEDVNFYFPSRHPKRMMWIDFFSNYGIKVLRQCDRYYNAGFISIRREDMAFLDLWSKLCDLVLTYNNGLKNIKTKSALDLFHSADQDALNFALMASEVTLNTMGSEGMDFLPGGNYFSHAIGTPKPWHGGHIRSALLGHRPSMADKCYYRFSNHPISVYTNATLIRRRIALAIASAIGRVYSSN